MTTMTDTAPAPDSATGFVIHLSPRSRWLLAASLPIGPACIAVL